MSVLNARSIPMPSKRAVENASLAASQIARRFFFWHHHDRFFRVHELWARRPVFFYYSLALRLFLAKISSMKVFMLRKKDQPDEVSFNRLINDLEEVRVSPKVLDPDSTEGVD